MLLHYTLVSVVSEIVASNKTMEPHNKKRKHNEEILLSVLGGIYDPGRLPVFQLVFQAQTFPVLWSRTKTRKRHKSHTPKLTV